MLRFALVTKSISLTLNACLVLSPVLWAGDTSRAAGPEPDKVEWNMEFEPMAMRVYGYEPDLLTILDVTIPAGDPELPDISAKTLADELDDWGFAFRGALEARKGRWGVGAKGFQFDTSSKFQRRVDAGDVFDDVTPDLLPGERFAYGYQSAAALSGFWVGFEEEFGEVDPGAAIIGNPGDGYVIYDGLAEAGELEPGTRQDFVARNELDVWSTDIYGFWRAVDHDFGILDVRLGAKIGSLDVGMDSSHSLAPGCDGGGCHFGMDLGTEVKSKALGGPYLAAAGSVRWGPVRFEAELAQSVLFGNVDYRTVGESFFDEPGGVSYERTLVSRSKSVTVPVTEASLKAVYDLTEFISIGAGAYTGVWWNAQVPATTEPNSVRINEGIGPLDFRRASGTDTGVDEEHLIFLGILGTVEVHFFGP